MQDLRQTLQDHDLGHLRVVAELWGLDLPPGPPVEAAAGLAAKLLEGILLDEGLHSLPESARLALAGLASEGGRLPWADVERRFGSVRGYGPGRRDREKPWRQPASDLESLWYRGLVARAFADTPLGLQEFGFIPADVLPHVLTTLRFDAVLYGSAASPPAEVQPASSRIFDDAVTLLAALRRRPAPGPELDSERRKRLSAFLFQPQSLELCLGLLAELSILSSPPLQPDPDAARGFLDAGRSAGITAMARAWGGSRSWNDLAHVPGLAHATRPWPNDPFAGRLAVLDLLQTLPLGTWWDLAEFVAAVKERRPGFQRPGGDFDAWFMQDSRSARFLRGFEHWDTVEGAMLIYMITGPLHWLGAVELGADQTGSPASVFRLGGTFPALVGKQANLDIQPAEGRPKLGADGGIRVPRTADAGLRYQLARMCAWKGLEGDTYLYHLTGGSLAGARKQGFKAAQVRALLNKLADGKMPGRLDQALRRYERQGADAQLSRHFVLELNDAETEHRLRADRRSARFLKRPIGEHAFLMDEADHAAFLRLASRLGLWLETGTESEDSP